MVGGILIGLNSIFLDRCWLVDVLWSIDFSLFWNSFCWFSGLIASVITYLSWIVRLSGLKIFLRGVRLPRYGPEMSIFSFFAFSSSTLMWLGREKSFDLTTGSMKLMIGSWLKLYLLPLSMFGWGGCWYPEVWDPPGCYFSIYFWASIFCLSVLLNNFIR